MFEREMIASKRSTADRPGGRVFQQFQLPGGIVVSYRVDHPGENPMEKASLRILFIENQEYRGPCATRTADDNAAARSESLNGPKDDLLSVDHVQSLRQKRPIQTASKAYFCIEGQDERGTFETGRKSSLTDYLHRTYHMHYFNQTNLRFIHLCDKFHRRTLLF
jgi:hypothetical protein